MTDEEIVLSRSETELLGRFGLASDGKILRLMETSEDFVLVPGLYDALKFESAPRLVFEPASPDAALLRSTPYRRYRSAAQKAAVRALLTMPAGGGLMVSMPTGSGKSLLFQIAALEARRRRTGSCVVVITPTVALALDHQRTLSGIAGLERSIALTGDLKGSAREDALFAFRRGDVPILLLSPEQVLSSAVSAALAEAAMDPAQKPGGLAASLAVFVIDEAHIVEQWGRSFRPDFQRLSSALAALRRHDPNLRALLLSATLPPAARRELRRSYGAAPQPWLEVDARAPRYEFDVAIQSFDDPAIRQTALDLAIDRVPRPVIVYTTLVEEASHLYDRLTRERGYRRAALFTGAISDPGQRRAIVDQWAVDEIDLVVATSAFGMGVDKADVRAVVHACLPEGPTRWYQEIGRAARDGYQGLAVCLFTDFGPQLGPTSDVRDAFGQSTRSWLGRDKAESRWRALVDRRRDMTWQGERRRLTLDLDAVREGLANFSGDYNRAWNRALLTLLQRAGVLEVVTTNPSGDEPGDLWVVDICDDRMFEKSMSNVWDYIMSVRDAEQAEAKEELSLFVALMRQPESKCVTRAAFELIEGGTVFAEPCGRCPSCRMRGVHPPRVLACSGLETAWPGPISCEEARLPAGVTLLAPYDPDFERGVEQLATSLARVGVEQLIVAAGHVDAAAEALIEIEPRYGFVLAYDEWSGPPTAFARVGTAVFLPANEGLARQLLARVRQVTLAWPEIMIIVVAQPDRELEGRRLDQTVSARAPISESMLDDLAADREVA
ncbi:DEAD/DEAH box helicase [Methylocapsa polymorpha]|uniref:DNA 3'-5' helicase n=1 Tax=Methylocapsa polymorpha TaxID=3080828 RepID=A0ABZ0HN56_9HYPH|nr:DEAD/DEAH box helicase [Methylocapsa sp. RX1]